MRRDPLPNIETPVAREFSHKRHRGHITQLLMWPKFIVVHTPSFDLLLGVVKGQKPIQVQTFIAEDSR